MQLTGFFELTPFQPFHRLEGARIGVYALRLRKRRPFIQNISLTPVFIPFYSTFLRRRYRASPISQKTMLLVEEKRIPMHISLVPMRSYGDKPREFMQKVPSGLLPAIEVNGQVITESQVIMELLDEWHPPSDGYRAMMPGDEAGMARYEKLARLEREYVTNNS